MGTNVDPATIRATAQRVVDEWVERSNTLLWWKSSSDAGRDRAIALVQAGADLAAQPDLNAVKREAASKAWDAAREFSLFHQADRRGQFVLARDEYLAREYPETRECVTVEVNDDIGSCFRVGYDGGWYAVGDKTGAKHTDLCKLVRAYSLDVSDAKMAELVNLAEAVR